MTQVVLSPFNVLTYMQGAGYAWVFVQYLQGLTRIGCKVHWLECVHRDVSPEELELYVHRLESLGLETPPIVCRVFSGGDDGEPKRLEFLTIDESDAKATLTGSDLLLNFNPWLEPELLSQPRRTALVDIDPGLHQVWLQQQQIVSPPHDVYFTVGERIDDTPEHLGEPRTWRSIPPPVCVETWPYSFDERCERFTTVTSWFGDYVTTEDESFDNGKRVSFLDFLELPRHTTGQSFELAVGLDDVAPDRRQLEANGWTIQDVTEVAASPESYRRYIQGSRGEFSCAKPLFVKFRNGWVSDRSVCYLSSGKPILVQDTGPSSVLPEGDGILRFGTLSEAIEAVEEVGADYRRHSEGARAVAEQYFDAKRVGERILDIAL